ncbi:hypothetical protein N1031_08385 [Herbiconiux moechotypicola]|uniref:Uncharacterized protein n=1 Tax=Herbiconiux moechotypicola TaxID=637393 RepID=A0ABP5QFZ0_9MICO|nr:hypothetical protein [Herbiconiux moechotypicola]MCS5729777.1 hypothetical protein [Herbiconiux moechotypicola]
MVQRTTRTGLIGSPSGGAEWYFIGATFAFAWSTMVFTQQGWVLGILCFAVGATLIVLGALTWGRAARRAAADSDEHPSPPEGGAPSGPHSP